jgi:hypothetical protein
MWHSKKQTLDDTKTISKQLYGAFLAYLIQSSTALALAYGAPVSPVSLNEASDSAKVLLSQVIHPSSHANKISSPLYCVGKSREEILAGSTEDAMRFFYSRNLYLSP